jgi:hypothetical protein
MSKLERKQEFKGTPRMERDLARFARICRYMYGKRWQKDAAYDLRFNERTVRAWAEGRTRITPPVWRAVEKLFNRKLALGPPLRDLLSRQIHSLKEDH